MIPSFVEMISRFELHPTYVDDVLSKNATAQASIKTVEQLKRMFSFMTLTNKKYVDPSPVVNSLVDDFG
jgi:hypothetical protein